MPHVDKEEMQVNPSFHCSCMPYTVHVCPKTDYLMTQLSRQNHIEKETNHIGIRVEHVIVKEYHKLMVKISHFITYVFFV